LKKGAPTTNVRFDAYKNNNTSNSGASTTTSTTTSISTVQESGLRSLWEDLQEYDSAEHLMCVTVAGTQKKCFFSNFLEVVSVLDNLSLYNRL
tara:strand:+ start:61 stop:339 length:279 start_codon:yes stop_codon:yes gene_type:complete